MILPRVKTETKLAGEFKLPKRFGVEVDVCISEKFCELLNVFLDGAVALSDDAEKYIIAEKKEMQNEEYRLHVSTENIKIEYYTYSGLRNAVSTISMLSKKDGDGFVIPCCSITDYPTMEHRGVMIDLARGIKPFDQLTEDIILVAKMKFNYLHLHLFDSRGVCMQMDSLPEACCLENRYSKEDMRKIVKLADVLALDVIPEFDMPAHSKKMVANLSELACDTDEENAGWTVCAGEEKVYELYAKIITELVEIFPSEYFHIGGDELEFNDAPEIKQLCHWDTCRKCIKKCEEEGLSGKQELYYYFILRIYDIVKKHGKKMMMWSDQLDCKRDIPLPRDIIMQFWRVALEGRGPVDGCSMKAQIDAGYVVINSFFEEIYGDLEGYMKAETIKTWNINKCPNTGAIADKGIIGSEFCTWEYGNSARYAHYEHSFAPSVAVVGDKFWNADVLCYTKEYSRAVTRAVLGIDTPAALDLFQCFGAVIPPKDDKAAYFDKIQCSVEDIRQTLETMKSMPDSRRCNIYKERIGKVLEEISLKK